MVSPEEGIHQFLRQTYNNNKTDDKHNHDNTNNNANANANANVNANANHKNLPVPPASSFATPDTDHTPIYKE